MNEIEPLEDGSGQAKLISTGPPVSPGGSRATFAKNSMMNVVRLAITTAIGFILPSFLIHRLPVATYSAWVLILQLSAYVNYLDFGIQTGIAKYVAEYDAKKDAAGLNKRASAGMLLLLCAAGVGVILTLVLAWKVPRLFHDMPPSLTHDVRLGLIFVGCSSAIGLLSSIFASIFMGLQRFAVPTVLVLINRVLFMAAILAVVHFHGTLALMGAMVAAVNLFTGLLHVIAWKRLAGAVRLHFHGMDFAVVRTMFIYCSSLAVWSIGMLCVSGLDVTIVGHYDFPRTAFYAIAVTPTNLMVAIVGAMLAPIMPAASALSVHGRSEQMGDLLAKATRLVSTILLLSGLPLLVGGYWLLRLWVGPAYAVQIMPYMRILVIANILRTTCAPYANFLAATNSQNTAVAGALAEAVVNLSASIYLARHLGAIGVAYGTLIGSFVSVGMHLAVSMHYTRVKMAISRRRFLLQGLFRPLIVALPSLALVSRWWTNSIPALNAPLWTAWCVATLVLAWIAGLDSSERSYMLGFIKRRLLLK